MARRCHLLQKAHVDAGGWHFVAVEQRPHHDVTHEQRRQQQSGHHTRQKQLGNRYIRRHAIDDQDDGRRYEQAQGAGAGQRAHRHLFRIAALLQFGQRDLAHGGASGGRRTGDGRKDGATHHIGVQQAAWQALQPGRQALEHVVGELAAEQDFAHPQEQWQGREGPAGGVAPDGEHHAVTHRARGEEFHADVGHRRQGKANPQARPQNGKQQHHQCQCDHDVHMLLSSSRHQAAVIRHGRLRRRSWP